MTPWERPLLAQDPALVHGREEMRCGPHGLSPTVCRTWIVDALNQAAQFGTNAWDAESRKEAS